MRLIACTLALSVVATMSPVSAGVGTDRGQPSASSYSLSFVKKIGVGWNGDKWGWMGFVSFSPDGKMVASDGPASPEDVSGDLTVWSFPEGRLVRRLPGRPWSMSDNWKYYADHNNVRDATSGKPHISLPEKSYVTYVFDKVAGYAAASSADNPAEGRIQISRVEDGGRVAAFGRHEAFALAFSPTGALLASGHWNTVTLWNMSNGSRLGALHGFGRYVKALSFSPKGTLLAAGTDTGELQMWDVVRRKRLYALEIGGGDVSTPAFSPNGKLVAVGIYGTGTVWLIDAHRGKILDHRKVSDLGCGAVAFSPDGRYLITPSTGGLITWPYDAGGTIRVFRIDHHVSSRN